MTDDEIQAWGSVTDEAAQHLVDTVTQAAGETLLRGALRKLMGFETTDEKFRVGLIYQALMAASDAGYECGIRVYDIVGNPPEVTAFIRLPNGAIGMGLVANYGNDYIAYDNHARETVRNFLGE